MSIRELRGSNQFNSTLQLKSLWYVTFHCWRVLGLESPRCVIWGRAQGKRWSSM